MKKTEKLLLSSAFFLFTAWLTLIVVKWGILQDLRHSDVLWLMNALSPHLFIIIVGLVLIISIAVLLNTRNIWFHTALITIFTMVLLCTPYFVGSVARFPDTFGVASTVGHLSAALTGTAGSYASDYPLAYFLFYIVKGVSGMNLFDYSQLIFSPAVLVSFITVWYLFIRRISTPRIALLAATLAVPAVIVEVTISPNSVGMILVMSALLLLATNTVRGKALMLLLSVVLVMVHPMNIIMLITFLVTFSFVNLLTRKQQRDNKVDVPVILAPLIIIGRLIWSLFESSRGSGIIRIVLNILTSKPSANTGGGVTTGTGFNSYSIVDEFMLGSYSLYALFGIIIVAYLVGSHALIVLKRRGRDQYGILGAHNLIPYMLISSIIFFIMTFASYFLISGGDQIVSRSMNYGILALSACISIFLLKICSSLREYNNGTFLKLIAASFAIGFIFVSVAYPIHGYSRESYISYTESQISGKNFDAEYAANIGAQNKKVFNSISENSARMESDYKALIFKKAYNDAHSSDLFSHTYTNNYYDIFVINVIP